MKKKTTLGCYGQFPNKEVLTRRYSCYLGLWEHNAGNMGLDRSVPVVVLFNVSIYHDNFVNGNAISTVKRGYRNILEDRLTLVTKTSQSWDPPAS